MLKRTITGAVILLITALFIALKQFNDIFFDVYVLIFSYGALYEMYKVHQLSKKEANFVCLFFVPAIICIILNVINDTSKILLYIGLVAMILLAITLVVEIIEFAWYRRCGLTEKNVSTLNQTLFHKTQATMKVFAYPVLPFMLFMTLNHIVYDLAYVGIIMVFAISMLTDTCAYLVGRCFGKRKFIPEVSPNKTIAGVIGGFLGGVIGSLGCFFLFYYTSLFEIEAFASFAKLVVIFVILGIFGSLITQLGDLIASAYKRKNNIKDFSNVFPGHGGFMDRADGLMFNAALIYIIFALFLV